MIARALLCLCCLSTLAAAAPGGLRGVVHKRHAQRLTQAAHAQLAAQDVAVVRGEERHFFALYDRNLYEGIPSFVTLDAILHVFHLRFDARLMEVELGVAAPALERFAEGQLRAALARWPEQGEPPPRLALLALYHAVPLALLRQEHIHQEIKIDPRLDPLIKPELERIDDAEGIARTPLCPLALDYSLFTPRGHYAQWRLRRYFKAASFYALCGFELSTPEGLQRAADVTRLMGEADRRALEQARRIFALVTGPADDPGHAALAPLLPPGLDPLTPAQLLAAQAGAARLLKPAVLDQPGATPALTFRLLGQGGVPDAILFSRVMDAARPLPSGLDLLAALGSEDARALLEPDLARSPRLRAAIEAPLPLERAGLYGRWLTILGQVVAPREAKLPFERAPAWARHLTVAAAGSWAELRHDTLLYVKQPIVWMQGGDGRELPARKAAGFVEPRPEIYAALRGLLGEINQHLGAPEGADKLEDLLRFLERVAELEIAEAPFPRAVDARLRTIGQELEALTLERGDELPPQALIADVATWVEPGGAARWLEVGIGDVDEIWVIAPRAGRRVLMRGGVFSYYEFAEEAARLNDRQWLRRLRDARPARPAWARPLEAKRRRARED